jgi:hypothetical protein
MIGYDLTTVGNIGSSLTLQPGSATKGIIFRTGGTSGTFPSGNVAMAIDSNGNIGIGTASPRTGSKLEVAGIMQTDAQSTDPGCTATADIGKFWFDNTTTTTGVKVCVDVAGTVEWGVVTHTP